MADITKIDSFIQSSPHPAWLATSQGQCVYVNPALERLTGFNSDEIIQADWRSFIVEEDRAVASASWQKSLATGAPYRAQVRMRGSDDVPKCVELIAFGYKGGNDTELWLFTGLDVQSVAAQKRPELEAQIQATLNVIPAYTWYCLPSGALTFVNERTANYLGLPKDHPLRFGIDTGADWDSHTALLHPDDREEARRVWSTCLCTGTAGEFTFRVPSAEGKYRWFLTRAEPLLASDGTLLYWIGVNLEIDDAKRAEDALRKSEKELRDVIDTIPAIVWSTFPDGSNTYVNKRFVEYSGSSAEQMAGSGWQALIHPDDLERHAAKWMEAVATGKPHENEVRSRRSDGQYRWQLDRGVPLRDGNGNIVKWYGVTTDIEDRKRAEESLQLMSSDLQDSKAKLEEAQRIAHVGYWEWDLTSNRVIWSDETYRIYGLRPQEFPIDIAVVKKLIHPEDLEFVFRVAEDAVRGGLRTDVEHRIIRSNGELRTVHSQGDLKKDASGRPNQMFGTVQDITDRKRAEQRLRESEAYLAEAQRLSQTGIWAWNPATGDIRYWSEMCYCVLGFDPAGPLPRFEEFFQRLNPDDQAASRGRFEKAIRDKADFELDYRVVHPEKGIRDIHVVGHAVLLGSSNLEFVGTVIDITERKRAEQELRQLVDFVPQLTVVLDSDGKLIHANRVAREYTGLTLEEFRSLDVIGRVIHPDDVERMRAQRERGLAGSEPFELDGRLLGKDGIYRWFLARYNPLIEEGRVRRWYMSATEIESRKQEEERIRQQNVRLEERTRIAQELHDTLLQTFQSALLHLGVALDSVAQESPAKPQLDRTLEIMTQGIEEGRNAIQGLRSSSSQTSDLVVALSSIQQELEVQSDIDFRVVVTGRQKELPRQIQNEIYRIGREALANAFCHSGAKSVELELEYSDSELRMRIRDNGCGINPQVLEKGRGGHWGLAGMRERAARIGGLVKILSSPMAGTEVQLSIPSNVAF